MDQDILVKRTVGSDLVGDRCFVCYSDFKLEHSVVKLRCRCIHWLCEDCLLTHVQQYWTCPCCRVPVASLDPKLQLLDAASQGDLEKVRELLELGISLSARGPWKETALMRASSEGHQEAATLLLDKGASISDKDIHNWSALEYAVAGGQTKLVTFLLDHGADIGAVDNKHQSLLHIATRHQHNLGLTETLLDRGAPHSVPNQEHQTALDLAESGEHKALAQLLRDRGALPGFLALPRWNEEHGRG